MPPLNLSVKIANAEEPRQRQRSCKDSTMRSSTFTKNRTMEQTKDLLNKSSSTRLRMRRMLSLQIFLTSRVDHSRKQPTGATTPNDADDDASTQHSSSWRKDSECSSAPHWQPARLDLVESMYAYNLCCYRMTGSRRILGCVIKRWQRKS